MQMYCRCITKTRSHVCTLFNKNTQKNRYKKNETCTFISNRHVFLLNEICNFRLFKYGPLISVYEILH